MKWLNRRKEIFPASFEAVWSAVSLPLLATVTPGAGRIRWPGTLAGKPAKGVVAMDQKDSAVRRRSKPVPRQDSFTVAELVLRAPQAALRYSLIKPWTACLRLIRAVTSTG